MRNNLDGLEKRLVCTMCRAPVRVVERKVWCTSPECRRSYPVDEHDIPQMLEGCASVEASPAPSPAASADAALNAPGGVDLAADPATHSTAVKASDSAAEITGGHSLPQ